MKKMNDALIGYSGFVGSTLLKQREFSAFFRSTNIKEARGQSFDLVICAGAPAQKWIANREPESDRQKIQGLIAELDRIHCKKFILMSTVDVYANPVGVTEETEIDESKLQPYGLNRYEIEKFVESRFPDHLIVRMPGLVGPGLRKNIIFDLLNNKLVESIDPRAIFQFYPMVNLWYDIQTALRLKLRKVNLTAEPVLASDVAFGCFGKRLENGSTGFPAHYDMRSNYAEDFGGRGSYQYSSRESFQAIRFYAQSEPKTEE